MSWNKHLTKFCIKFPLNRNYVLTLPWQIWNDKNLLLTAKRLAAKIVPEMTYNVSSDILTSTLPPQSVLYLRVVHAVWPMSLPCWWKWWRSRPASWNIKCIGLISSQKNNVSVSLLEVLDLVSFSCEKVSSRIFIFSILCSPLLCVCVCACVCFTMFCMDMYACFMFLLAKLLKMIMWTMIYRELDKWFWSEHKSHF